MTSGTKVFRIVISVLLAITMLISGFFTFFFTIYFAKDPYGIYVAGVSVDRDNDDDILGDGRVSYDATNNLLILDNATIESDLTVIYSMIDLHIMLVGENKIICTGEQSGIGIYAGNSHLYKDLAIIGDGSLTIEVPDAKGDAAGIVADNLTIGSTVTVTTSDCENMTNGIVCSTSLMLISKANVTVNNGAAKYSSAVRVRGNALFEAESTLKISAKPGATEICRGIAVNGDLFLNEDSILEVTIDDAGTDKGECILVSGLFSVGSGTSVTAVSKNAPAIECFGTIEVSSGSTITADAENNNDIFCTGAVVNYGAEIDADVEAVGGVHDR